ncbi:hypothetical protein NVV93_14600 [Pseudomonas sp. LS44]|uniref:hypothetical protein n=1 Tax=Pseudomonas sp. LS44 TaxID=1357074 RepID=UPI00215AC476|nr:hypothetical protein [Pseudomonas sp. LS44]UVE16816.1 hypothetical protein NVV93_14600 [Pseudomonas sp. LS44]
MSRAKEKDATEDYRALDVRWLHRRGALLSGYSCSLEWKRRGVVVASIGIRTESPTCIRLRYQAKVRGKPEPRDYPVPITWTPCHLGGERPWFLCPSCGRRVAKLYGGSEFACRHCWRLNYASQQANKRDRASDQSFKLRDALGCDEGFLFTPAEFIPKPKGMHWRTFERKIEQLKQVDARALEDAAAMLASIERGMGIYAASVDRL